MATTKRSTTKPADTKAEADSTEAKPADGVSANLLQFVNPDLAAKAVVDAEGKKADLPVVPEGTGEDEGKGTSDSDPKVVPEAETDPASEPQAEEPAPASETVDGAEASGAEYIVLATALGGADGRMHSAGSLVTLDEKQASWLLSRGMVKPA